MNRETSDGEIKLRALLTHVMFELIRNRANAECDGDLSQALKKHSEEYVEFIRLIQKIDPSSDSEIQTEPDKALSGLLRRLSKRL